MDMHAPRSISVKALLIETMKLAMICTLYAVATLGFIIIMGAGQ